MDESLDAERKWDSEVGKVPAASVLPSAPRR